ncbi:TonB-linked SusC/RagA family outer membrane protein [Breznakibacter xylanolyticus]|uniref:TonB-linked SusC/RagA family outer membrane protein n=1 Tax=Breznakibacter xylanolyticus TaxID=990 RepID=A0A2W7NDY1_9BACT|nr:SusC/RagA family TonB-linked outer membrane protein [Breznakibacter xylanolyticus]PZX18625.1 TonB-linked SusC/RagA family outer membrane protein [Breznakibacter xylanolyticus]
MNYLHKTLMTALALLVSCGALIGQSEAAQTKTVAGVVFDAATLQPIEIAAVNCGTLSSTFTDLDGSFSLNVSGIADVLTVKAMGYHDKHVVVGNRDSVFIYLKDVGAYSLFESAQSGYFNVNQVYTTQSVVGVNRFDDKKRQILGSAEAAFNGRVAGLNALSRNGIKGVGSDLIIRGNSSLNASNQPLVVVDGMIYDINAYGISLIPGYKNNPLGGINVDDIESVSVIRDAASVYGAKAANGVILIRTTRAQKQATTIDFHLSGGLELSPESLPLLDAESYRSYLNEMLLSSGKSGTAINAMPYFINDPAVAGYYTARNNTDWQKKVFANSYSSNYGLSIKGGDDVALYALNVGYMTQGGIVDGSDNNRFNLRFNSDINISKAIQLNSTIGFHYIQKNITASGIEGSADAVHQARVKAPFLQERERNILGLTTPVYCGYDSLQVSNPVALLNGLKQEDMNYRFFGAFNFNVNSGKHLSVADQIGISFDKERQSIFIPGSGVTPDSVYNGVRINQMMQSVTRHMAVNNDLRLVYDNTFAAFHHLNGVAGARLNINMLEQDWGKDYNSANDQIYTLGSGDYLLRQKGGLMGDWSSLTWYTNVNYDFQKKYFLSASMSLDGSSRFGKDAQGLKMFNTVFGFFPAVSAAWLISSEPFMAGLNWLDVLKLRAGYGMTGNDDIGNYRALRYYTEKSFLNSQGAVIGNVGNSELSWEKNTKINIGLDVAVAHERVSMSVDVYQNKTTDMIDYISGQTLFSGIDGYWANVGGLTTTGLDLMLNGRIINRPFRWDLGVIVSKYSTEMDELWDGSRITTMYDANILTQKGAPIGQFYGYKTNGVYASAAEASAAGLSAVMPNGDKVAFLGGDVRFVEKTVDGVIDASDMQVIGDATPDFTGEIFTKVRYKKLTLDASLSFSYGGDVFNYMRYTMERMSNFDNQTQGVLNRWQYDGQITSAPRADYGDTMGNARFSDRWIEDGSYARLKNVTISYVVPFKLGFLKRAEVYASGLNLVTWTKYKGLDPDFSLNGSALSRGIDLGMIPQNRAFIFGVKIGL